MKAEFEVNMTVNDMYNFNVYHNYHNLGGVAGLLFGVIAIAIAIISYGQVNISYTLMVGFFGLFFTVITPLRILLKSAQQVKLTPMFKKPLKYIISEDNILIKQDEAEAEILWEDVYRVKQTNKSLVIYVTPIRAYILPDRESGAQRETVVNIIADKVEPKKVKLKKNQ